MMLVAIYLNYKRELPEVNKNKFQKIIDHEQIRPQEIIKKFQKRL